ncbi:XRE family transcriptional regulator [Kribbella antibiotica]|uniref:XRE family transcriptional regulator n=1 Tax=Kribbella antibiotica TaxID=190195 RepID=A0A4R4ZAQ4_9ACTN|nr:helix-turn-helix transcriptional regulator [Kribbella antibiotica]TDD55418.1 XRE family transcriptional regulator [Kribbella antibiotica]
MNLAPSPAAELADRLRALRRQQRMTQATLAHALGISVSAISSWENSSDDKLPRADRLRPYALFFALDHSAETVPQLPREQDLNASERETFTALNRELIGLREAARNSPGTASADASLWTFETGPVTAICPEAPVAYRSPLADEANPNFTRMYRYADVDALIELWGHLRSRNPELEVAHRLPEEASPPDLTGHLVLLGGTVWNNVAHQLQTLLRDLPIQQVVVPDLFNGEIFMLPDGQEFRPLWSDYERTSAKPPTKEEITAEQTEDVWRDGRRRTLVEDVAFLARVPNPLNHTRTLTVCSGVYSRGVLGAVRALTDTAVRERNEAYLANRFPGGSFAILMRVPLVNGEAMSPDLEIPHNVLYEWSPSDEAPA